MAQDNLDVAEENAPLPTVIYGTDNRTELREQAGAEGNLRPNLCVMVSSEYIEVGATANTSKLKNRVTLLERVQAALAAAGCSFDPQVRFSDQPVIGYGTAFLIRPGLIATVAHNLFTPESRHQTRKPDEGARCIFNWSMGANNAQPPVNLPNGDIRGFRTLKYCFNRESNIGPDVALLQTGTWDGNVFTPDQYTNAAALNLNILPIDLSPREKIWMAGFPWGLPMKYSPSRVRHSHPQYSYCASFDSFKGNSGSPVLLRETTDVVGLVSGVIFSPTGPRLDYQRVGDVITQPIYDALEKPQIHAIVFQNTKILRQMLSTDFYVAIEINYHERRTIDVPITISINGGTAATFERTFERGMTHPLKPAGGYLAHDLPVMVAQITEIKIEIPKGSGAYTIDSVRILADNTYLAALPGGEVRGETPLTVQWSEVWPVGT